MFCLGVYTGAVPDEEFRVISVDDTVEFARVLRASSPSAAFSFLAGAALTGRNKAGFTPDTVPGDLIKVEFIEKDSKRFSDTHGWGYAMFDYDAASVRSGCYPGQQAAAEQRCQVLPHASGIKGLHFHGLWT